MRLFLRVLCPALVWTCAAAWAQPLPPKQAPESPAIIRVTSKEVLVDVVVRDKRGRFIHKLGAGDFVVTEDGNPQHVTGFREVTGPEAVTALSDPNSTSAPVSRPKTADSNTREVRLVSLVFERLGIESRKLARQGALDMVNREIPANVYYGVFYIDQRLRVIQTFTNDRAKIRAAVEKATGITGSDFANDNASAKLAVQETGGSSGAADATASAAASSRGAAAVNSAGMANEQMNRMVTDMLEFSEELARDQEGRSSIYSLLAMVHEQGRLPGRKAMVYFTEGIQLPNSMWSQFETLISAANRANVSVYAVDARGLTVKSDMAAANAALATAAGNSYGIWARSTESTPVTRGQAMVFDTAMDALRANVQAVLQELAESTGGALIANTNDLRQPLRKVDEEISSFYEISYQPHNDNYDGRFHEIGVKVNRSNAQVMSRSGYFSLPSMEGQIVYPYEVPLLNAVAKAPLPKAFDYRASVIQFQPQTGGRQSSLVFDLPLKEVTFAKDEAGKTYRTHISVMALIKDSSGRVAAKLSRDVPVKEPLDKLDSFRNGRFIVTRVVKLPPGRYTVESAVADREGQKISAKRSALVIPPPNQSVSMSGITLIRRFEKAPLDPELDDPYVNAKSKVIPTLIDTVPGGKGSVLSLYFAIYPQAGLAEPVKLLMEFLQDGKLVVKGSPDLPPPDSRGVIPYIANTPIESLKPGQYEVRVTVAQGGRAAQESKFVTIE